MRKVGISEIAKYPDVGFYLKDDKNDVKRYIVADELTNPIYMGYYPLSGKDRSKVDVSVKEGTYVYVTQYDYRYKTEISQVCNRGRKYNSRKFVIHVDYDTYNYLQSKGNPEDYILKLIIDDMKKKEREG